MDNIEIKNNQNQVQQTLAQSSTEIASPAGEITSALAEIIKNNILKVSGIFLLLLAIILGGVMYLSGGNFTQSGVVISLSGEDEVSSGQIYNYEIKYANNTEQDIENVVLNVYLPTDIYVVATEAYEEKSIIRIPIDNIKAGDENYYNLKLVFTGDVDSFRLIRSQLEYSPLGLSTRLTNDTQLRVQITSAPLSIDVERPQNISPNQNIKYLIKYKNERESVLEGFRLNLVLPDGFVFQSSEPSLVAGKYVEIDQLEPGEERVLEVDGNLRGVTGQAKILRIGVDMALVLGSNDSYREVQYLEDEVVLASPPFNFSAIVNGSTNYSAGLGDVLNYEFTFRNDTSVVFNNLNLDIDLAGSMFDVSKLDTEGQILSGGKNIMYDVTHQPSLGILRPGESVKVSFRVGVNRSLPLFGKTTDDDLLIRLKLNSPAVPTGVSADVLPLALEHRTRILVGSTFGSGVYRNLDGFNASGEFPPKVGKESQFIINFKALSQVSGLKNVVMTAKLAPGVKWLDRTRVIASTINPITYDSRLNIINWKIGDIPPGSGGADVSKKVEGIFMISAIPNPSSLNQPLDLISDVVFEGIDTSRNQPYRFSIRNINTSKVEGESVGGLVVE